MVLYKKGVRLHGWQKDRTKEKGPELGFILFCDRKQGRSGRQDLFAVSSNARSLIVLFVKMGDWVCQSSVKLLDQLSCIVKPHSLSLVELFTSCD